MSERGDAADRVARRLPHCVGVFPPRPLPSGAAGQLPLVEKVVAVTPVDDGPACRHDRRMRNDDIRRSAAGASSCSSSVGPAGGPAPTGVETMSVGSGGLTAAWLGAPPSGSADAVGPSSAAPAPGSSPASTSSPVSSGPAASRRAAASAASRASASERVSSSVTSSSVERTSR